MHEGYGWLLHNDVKVAMCIDANIGTGLECK